MKWLLATSSVSSLMLHAASSSQREESWEHCCAHTCGQGACKFLKMA